MPTTTRGYPYPAGADAAAGPAQIQAAVAAIDTDISTSLPDMAVTSFGDVGSFLAGATSNSVLSSANDSAVAVIRPRATFTPTKFVWWCVTQNGNYDIAIINATTRVRLWSLGSTACPAAGQQVVAIAGAPTLTAGTRYGLVIASSSATFAIQTSPTLPTGASTLYDGVIAAGRVAASFPIPATLGAWSEWTRMPALALRA
jgi:hypothetical protein